MRFLAFFKRRLVAAAKRGLRKFGYELIHDSSAYMTMDGGIARLKERGISLESVIDVGASNGRWTELCLKHYPNAAYHMLEAQEEYDGPLTELCNKNSKLSYTIKAVADKSGEIYFDDHVVGGGIASREKVNENFKRKLATTIDDEVAAFKLKAPYFVKLDTHGFEVQILEGATETLKKANALVIECYNFRLNENAKKFHEMVAYLETKGFHCIDIVDLTLRKSDSFLWQMDIFFARSEMKGFSNSTF
jgi:FkbM family methyltransferase